MFDADSGNGVGISKKQTSVNKALRVRIPLGDTIPLFDSTFSYLSSTLVLVSLLFCQNNAIFVTK